MTLEKFDTELLVKFEEIISFIKKTKISNLDEYQEGYQEQLLEDLMIFLDETGLYINNDEDDDMY